MPNPNERRVRFLDEHRDGAIRLRFYECDGKEFWRLVRDTPKGPAAIAVGRSSEIPAIGRVFDGASRSRSVSRGGPRHADTPRQGAEAPRRPWWSAVRAAIADLLRTPGSPRQGPPEGTPRQAAKPEGRPWYALIRLDELTAEGAKGRVVRSIDDLEKAGTYRDKHKHLALYTQPFAHPPDKGTRVEVKESEVQALNRKGEGQDLARQFRVLRWKQGQGTYFNWGYWNERGEEPRLGQDVRFTVGLDYRGEPRDRLVAPIRSIDPGPPEASRPVVFEMSRKTPGLGRIVDLPGEPGDAVMRVRELDAEQLGRDQVLHREQWATLAVGPGLREQARREVPPWRLETHDLGSRRVEVIDRVGEGGKRDRTYIVTREVREADGRVRTDSVVLDAADIRAVREAERVAKRRDREEGRREKVERREHQPSPTAAAGAGNETLERPVQIALPLRERTREAPKPDVSAGEQTPKRDVIPLPGHSDGQEGQDVRRPSNAPPGPAVAARGRRPAVLVGTWSGEEPPIPGKTWVRFDPNRPARERVMTPVRGEAKAPEPGKPKRYLLVDVVSLSPMPSGVVREVTDDFKHVEGRAKAINQQAFKRQQHAERAEQPNRPKQGHEQRPSMGL